MTQKCCICRKPIPANQSQGPFCSDRCRLLDLGAWVTERYRIPVTGSDKPIPEDDSEQDQSQQAKPSQEELA